MYSKQNEKKGGIFNRVKKALPSTVPDKLLRRYGAGASLLTGQAGITPVQSLRSLRGKPASPAPVTLRYGASPQAFGGAGKTTPTLNFCSKNVMKSMILSA